ncbi:MAG: LysE family transporter [Betaproteobacteria bacterium]
MSLELWLAWIATLSAMSFSPGTGVAVVLSTAMASGGRRAWPLVLGMQVPLLMYALIVSLGMSAMMRHGPVFAVIKWAGVAYLAWLGLRSLFARPVIAPDAQRGARQDGWTRFSEGFIVNATNPKIVVFMAAMFPLFVRPDAPIAPQLLILCATLFAIDIVVMMGYAHLAATLVRWMKDPRHLAWLNRIIGAWFIVLAALLATEF